MSTAIANAFGIDTPTEYPTKEETGLAVIDEATGKLQDRLQKNIDKDYDFVRGNLREMIESTMTMIPNLVDLVQQAESARMYESASAFMKMIADLNKDLLSTSKELEKGSSKGTVPTPASIQSETTNVYIGTGGDIFSRLSKPKLNEDIEKLPIINPTK